MQIRRSNRLDRWIGILGSVTVGGVFGLLFWLNGYDVLGIVIFVFTAAVGLCLMLASDETFERTPWWLFW
jgi:hypothetical protein